MYPVVSLKEARRLRDEAKKLLARSVDPSVQRKADKQSRLQRKVLANARAMLSGNGGVPTATTRVVTCWKPIMARRRQCSIATVKTHGGPAAISIFAINLFTGPWAVTRTVHSARETQTHTATVMTPRSELVTSSRISPRFQRRLPGGPYDLVFEVAFDSNGVAARSLGRSRTQIWRYRRGQSPVPRWVIDVLTDRVRRAISKRALSSGHTSAPAWRERQVARAPSSR